jgi:hypothetical protein
MMMDIFLNCQYGRAIEDSGLDLLISWQSRFQDHGDREDDDGQVGDDIEDCGGDEVGVALSALRTWIWDHLPVVSEGLACSKVADDGGYESYSEEDV